MRRLLATLGLAVGIFVLSGHVGSPNVILDGEAGPYPVRVIVRPPEVIPGQAEITVRALGEGVTAVSVRPVRWDLGVRGAPRPDPAAPVAGEAGLWSARLWLMDFGSYSVHVTVAGARGEGTLIVPVPAVATRVASMPAKLAIPLVGLGLFLTVGLLTLVGAAVREAVLPPGVEPDAPRRRRAWIARAVALPLFALFLFGGSLWWDAEDAMYGRHLYRAPEAEATVTADGRLTLGVEGWRGEGWSDASPILPDHGKLMHLFLVRQPGLDVFAHLHPARADSLAFATPLPPLPPGEYRVYGDVLHESGFQTTLTDTVRIPAGAGASTLDPDDSWLVGGGDASITLLSPTAPLRAGEATTLRFRVADASGAPARLEPYMGMLAHAAVTRDDGSVFVHLHPGGTVSATAQARFAQIASGDTARDATGKLLTPAHASHAPPAPDGGIVEIPYEFPSAGSYRLWVQVKQDGRVLTRAFDLRVTG